MKDRENRRVIGRSEWTGPRQVDAAARAQTLKIWTWSASAGGIIGFFAGLAAGGLVGALAGVVVGPVLVGSLVTAVTSFGGWTAARIHNPSGSTTPHEREFSRASALVARGRYRDALDELESHVLDDPSDPAPYLRIARIYRDHLEEYEDALRWFKRARDEAGLSERGEASVGREIVDIYQVRLGDPRRAAPELARLRERFEGTTTGAWAERELAEVKERIRREDHPDS